MNSSGKVLTIFLVIIAILLISLTAISLFFFQKETDRRKLAEAQLEESQTQNIQFEHDLKEVRKQSFLLQEKNKEADDRINDLSDELELEKGLREEMKLEAAALKSQVEEALISKEALAQEIEEKIILQGQLTTDLSASREKIAELEAQLEAEGRVGKELGELDEQIFKEESQGAGQDTVDNDLGLGGELKEIVVAPQEIIGEQEISSPRGAVTEEAITSFDETLNGRILSVDTETEFVIVSLGKKDGLGVGHILSVFRGANYVGDIKITRLQPEMSAADLIPPFSIKSVQRNDQVKVK